MLKRILRIAAGSVIMLIIGIILSVIIHTYFDVSNLEFSSIILIISFIIGWFFGDKIYGK